MILASSTSPYRLCSGTTSPLAKFNLTFKKKTMGAQLEWYIRY